MPAVDEPLIDRPSRPVPDLVPRGLPRPPVIGIPRPRHSTHNEVAPVGRDHAPLYAELLPLVGFALTDARHFRCKQAVPLVPALLLRRPQLPSPRPLVRKHSPEVRSAHGFSFKIPNRPTQVGPQTPDRTVQTAEPAGRGGPVRSPPRRRPLAGAALPSPHLIRSAPPHQPGPGTVQPLAVRRAGHSLVRHRRLHGHPPPRPRLHGPIVQARIHRCLPDPLGVGGPEARAESRQTARVDRRRVRELFLATKIRPVRILHPTRHHGLVRPLVELLEILPPDHSAGGLGRIFRLKWQGMEHP